ncbi:diaminopropionate ammonia-lyase [Saccharopolyspora sp. NPDC050389]|uniref:diaminopropionate ammonia-lyase n=1 Tax=Saccharopolyspora sp. NPDC050389 TaxID=3155516 RepID=UPI0033D482B7
MSPNIAVTTGSWFFNPGARDWACPPAPAEAASFHAGLPGYAPTPLLELPGLAAEWGVGRVVVKDESTRFGLPAFKSLGVSYAIYRVICDHAGETVRPADLPGLREMLGSLPRLDLVTATDGNHGRAVARFARLLGIRAHVFVPDVVSPGAVEAIRAEQAEVTVLADDYDATVRSASEAAESRSSAVLLQDTAWPGYEEIPQWIVDGYSTLLVELDAQLGATGPSLVVVPMGVGSLAQAVVTHYRSREQRAALLGVEPDTAACIQTGLASGRPCTVQTGSTIMAGLNCGTPSSLAWPYLRDGLDAVVAVSDEQAAGAARELAALGVSSGPCGAATLAAARAVLAEAAPSRRAALGLSADSTIALLNTEGAHETRR